MHPCSMNLQCFWNVIRREGQEYKERRHSQCSVKYPVYEIGRQQPSPTQVGDVPDPGWARGFVERNKRIHTIVRGEPGFDEVYCQIGRS